jgi:hypothetical protein
VRLTAYCTFIALLVQLELAIASVYVKQVGVDMVRVAVCLSVSLSASIALCIVWVPRTALILHEKLQSSNTDESVASDGLRAKNNSNKSGSRPNEHKVEADVIVPLGALFSVPNRASNLGLLRISSAGTDRRGTPDSPRSRSSGSNTAGQAVADSKL